MQVREEFRFGVVAGAVGMADADGHFVGKGARGGTLQLTGGGGEGEASAKDILVNRGDIEAFAGKALDDLGDAGALIFALVAVGESGEDADGGDGAMFDWTDR
jgi:hypothetical protein